MTDKRDCVHPEPPSKPPSGPAPEPPPGAASLFGYDIEYVDIRAALLRILKASQEVCLRNQGHLPDEFLDALTAGYEALK